MKIYSMHVGDLNFMTVVPRAISSFPRITRRKSIIHVNWHGLVNSSRIVLYMCPIPPEWHSRLLRFLLEIQRFLL